MKKSSFYLYLSLFCVHVLIAAIAFVHFRQHPGGVLFCDIGDGLKNLFTLTTYVKEPISAGGILKYDFFQYPFGDYVYYTDNTPLFSIPFRWICHHVYDLSAYTVIVLYCVVILNIIASGLLIYHILRKLTGENTISYLMAIILPWANMQILRIWAGHTAFSFSSLILLATWLMMLWHKHKDNRKKQVMVGVGMCLLSFLGFLAQGYYLAIITMFSCAMLFFYGVFYRKEKQGLFSMLAAPVVAVVSLCLVLVLLGITDGYLPLRPVSATGYDWMELKIRFTALFSRYLFQRVYFPISAGYISSEAELAGYLGNVGLYAFLVFGIAVVVSKKFREFMVRTQKDFFADPLKATILLGGLVLLFISFGEHYYTEEPYTKGILFLNILNPFFYLHYFTKRVEQFRALERFIWPFFFVFNIWIVYTITAVYKEYNNKIKMLVIASILLFGGYETRDFVREMQAQTAHKNIFSADALSGITPPNVQFGRYQAILPIPYYSLGAEDYDLDMIDDEKWSNLTYRLSIKSGLPLMACKMSRTPAVYSRVLMGFVGFDSMDVRLKERLTNKPVLVAVCKRLLTDSSGKNIPHEGYAAAVYSNSLRFASRNHLQAIDSSDEVIYYEWYPAAKM